MEPEIIEFLQESNAIECVYDSDSLDQAVQAWEFLMRCEYMTHEFVMETHKILMKNQNIESKYKGEYRDVDIYIGGSEGMPANVLNFYLGEWCVEMNEAQAPDAEEAEILSKVLHVMYEKIHPFIDGNGRTGRMFMNWLRLKRLNLPLLIIHEGAEQYEYYNWFR